MHAAWREHTWDAVLLDTAASLRLWGGLPSLLALLEPQGRELGLARLATGSTGLEALARLYSAQSDKAAAPSIGELLLQNLSAAWPHLQILHQMGCTSWGQLDAMPRGGITRRFGASLLVALDQAYGRKSEAYTWLTAPEVFTVSHELHANVDNASGLLFTASRQLKLLQAWLRARHLGVLSCQLTWLLDIRRNAAPRGEFILQTGEPTQDIKHLERLLSEHLDRIELPAPAHTLQLRSLRCEALPQISESLLPDEQRRGEPLHVFIERVASKLGAGSVCRPVMRADHRPEAAQHWISAALPFGAVKQTAKYVLSAAHAAHSYRPAWLMAEPLRLLVQGDKPYYQGPLKLLQGPERIESSFLVDAVSAATTQPTGLARDYFMAWSANAGLLWIFRERLSEQPGWYLHGLFA